MRLLTLVLLQLAGGCLAQLSVSAASAPPSCADQFGEDLRFLGLAKSVQIGDIRYSYHRFGNTSTNKPALVAIQGLGNTQYAWGAAMLQEFAKSREVIILDNALAGLSTQVSNRNLTLSIPFMAASTVTFINTLKLKCKPDIMGLSMGGMVAQYIGGFHSDSVRSIVAVSTSYGKGAPEPKGGINAMLDYLSTADSKTNVSLLLPLGVQDPGFMPLYAHIMALTCAVGGANASDAGYAVIGGIVPQDVLAATDVTLSVRAKQADAIRTLWATTSLLPRLAASKRRVLFIHGTDDIIFPIATASRAAAAVPNSWLVEVPAAGHCVMCADAVGFAQKVLQFLNANERQDKQERKALQAAATRLCPLASKP
ncbi:hypothetical protein ABPG77_002324 [Micractinium sp. CCAP 211/92]